VHQFGYLIEINARCTVNKTSNKLNDCCSRKPRLLVTGRVFRGDSFKGLIVHFWMGSELKTLKALASVVSVWILHVVCTPKTTLRHFFILILVLCIFCYYVLWPTNAQLFKKLSHSNMFQHYHVILRELVIRNLPCCTSIKSMWNILIVNCVTNSCIWNTCVAWQSIDYKLPEDDMIVSKHVGW
jgi:hypothetical protein